MRCARSLCVTVAAVVALLALPTLAQAADPPNPNDPCSTGTRNTCGTTGVGFYETYRYGTRWFGDFRGLVPGRVPHVLHRPALLVPGPPVPRTSDASVTGLQEPGWRDGDAVSNLQKIAYAIWTYGRTTNANAGGRRDALRPLADGRREARRARPRPRLQPARRRPARGGRCRNAGPLPRAVPRRRSPFPPRIGAGKTATAPGPGDLGRGQSPFPNRRSLLVGHRRAPRPRPCMTNASGVATVARFSDHGRAACT